MATMSADQKCGVQVGVPPGYWYWHTCARPVKAVITTRDGSEQGVCGIHKNRHGRVALSDWDFKLQTEEEPVNTNPAHTQPLVAAIASALMEPDNPQVITTILDRIPDGWAKVDGQWIQLLEKPGLYLGPPIDHAAPSHCLSCGSANVSWGGSDVGWCCHSCGRTDADE